MSKETYQPKFSDNIIPEWSFGLLGALAEKKNSLKKLWSAEARQEVKSLHKNWDNTSYCRSMSVDAIRQYSADEIITLLEPNWNTFTDEYSLGTPIKKYEYTALHANNGDLIGTNGLENAYQENAQAQAVRFQKRLERAGHTKQRGEIETFNSQRLDSCVIQALERDDVPEGTKIIWFSPPGFKIEGYHGVSNKNHSFIWVYEKKVDEDGAFIEMTQFRCWPSLPQMERVHSKLEALSQNSGLLPPFPEGVALTRRNALIAQMLELPENVSLAQIEKTIYASEKNWRVQRKHMPDEQLSADDKEAFFAQRQLLLKEFLLPIYQKLLDNPIATSWLTTPYSNSYWQSEEYQLLISQLDIAFALSKQALDKWIEERVESGTEAFIPISSLYELFDLQIKHITEGLTTEEAVKFNLMAPTLLSLGNRMLSIGQCGLGTVVPLNLIAKLGNIRGAGITGAPVTKVAAIGQKEVSGLSSKEKKQFQKDVLGRYSRLEVKGRNGNTNVFWVLNEYYSDYVGNCYEDEQGVLRGPCDVPLTMEDDDFILTDEKYQELLAASLEETSYEDQLAQLAQEEKNLLSQAKNDDERSFIRRKFAIKRDRLKSSVSLTELLNNDIYLYQSTVYTSVAMAA